MRETQEAGAAKGWRWRAGLQVAGWARPPRHWRGSKGDNQRGAFDVLLYAIVIIVRPEDGSRVPPRGCEAGCHRRSVRTGLAPRSLTTAAYPNRLLIILGRCSDEWE